MLFENKKQKFWSQAFLIIKALVLVFTLSWYIRNWDYFSNHSNFLLCVMKVSGEFVFLHWFYIFFDWSSSFESHIIHLISWGSIYSSILPWFLTLLLYFFQFFWLIGFVLFGIVFWVIHLNQYPKNFIKFEFLNCFWVFL